MTKAEAMKALKAEIDNLKLAGAKHRRSAELNWALADETHEHAIRLEVAFDHLVEAEEEHRG